MSDKYACSHCGLDRTDPIVKAFVELMKAKFDDTEVISGTRCDAHNRAVGGENRSGHLPIWGADKSHSVAVDMSLGAWSEERARHFAAEGVRHGATGIGFMPDNHSVHFDFKPRTQWWRKRNGKYEYFF